MFNIVNPSNAKKTLFGQLECYTKVFLRVQDRDVVIILVNII